jgi:hypothetical protein
MKFAAAESPLRRTLLLALALAAVIAAIYSLRSRARSQARRAQQAASSAAPFVEVDLALPEPSASSLATPARVDKTVRDRTQRDDARARIYRAFDRPPPERKPNSEAPSAPLGDGAPRLDKDYIQKRIREDFVPLAKECYDAALERDPKLGGKLVLSFVIVGDEDVGGVVESAELDPASTLSEKELVYCMRESLLSLAFEPPKNGGSVSVIYPFILSPDGPDGG